MGFYHLLEIFEKIWAINSAKKSTTDAIKLFQKKQFRKQEKQQVIYS